MNHYSINHLLNKMDDTNNIHLNITDMSGHTFTIKLHWDIGAMKDSISIYYDNKFRNDFLLENNLTHRDMIKHMNKYLSSDYYKKANDYNPDNIQLIYKGEILEQYHVEADLITVEDLQKNNNMNVVICKNNHDNDDNYNSSTDDDDDNNSNTDD